MFTLAVRSLGLVWRAIHHSEEILCVYFVDQYLTIVYGTRSAMGRIDSARVIPMGAGVDAKSVFDSITAVHLKTPDDNRLLLHTRAMQKLLEAGHVDRIYWFGTDTMLPGGLTKGSVIRCCYETGMADS